MDHEFAGYKIQNELMLQITPAVIYLFLQRIYVVVTIFGTVLLYLVVRLYTQTIPDDINMYTFIAVYVMQFLIILVYDADRKQLFSSLCRHKRRADEAVVHKSHFLR